MNTARAADIDNHPWLLILDTEVWRRSPYELEGRRVVNSQHSLPLLIRHLYDFSNSQNSCAQLTVKWID